MNVTATTNSGTHAFINGEWFPPIAVSGAVHADVLQSFLALADSLHFTVRNLTFSPVKGPEGNIEFLAHLSMQPGQAQIPDVAALVAQAHETLKG